MEFQPLFVEETDRYRTEDGLIIFLAFQYRGNEGIMSFKIPLENEIKCNNLLYSKFVGEPLEIHFHDRNRFTNLHKEELQRKYLITVRSVMEMPVITEIKYYKTDERGAYYGV